MNTFAERAREKGKPLVTMAVLRKDMAFVEMAAQVGVDVLWVEMEHMDVPFPEAAEVVALASALGLLTLIRVPNAERENVLRAAECGPDILDLPMVEKAADAEELVRHARFAPGGQRGHFGGSRATRYGLFGDLVQERQRINEELALMVQIETAQAVERAEEIAAVEGVDALFVGRGDLSASLGMPGEAGHPVVEEATERVIQVAEKHGKLVGVPGRPEEYERWTARGVHLFLCGGDLACMKTGLEEFMRALRPGR